MILIHRFLYSVIANEDTTRYHECIVIWSYIYLLKKLFIFLFMKNTLKAGIVISMLTLPTFAFAAPSFAGSPLKAFFDGITDILEYLVPFLILAAGVLFMWGLVKYVANASDEAAKESAKTLMIWGMVAIFVMVSFWGIIGFFSSTLQLDDATVIVAPPTVLLAPR